MKTLLASALSAALLLAGTAMAQQVGAGANVGPVGAGASAGGQGVGVGAHVGTLGANVGVGVQRVFHCTADHMNVIGCKGRDLIPLN